MRLSNFIALTSFLGLFTPAWGRIHAGSAMDGLADAANFQLEHMQAMRSFLGPDGPAQNVKRDTTVQFNNPKAQQFFVDGTKIPDG